MFDLKAKFKPTGDQPQAIAKLTKGLELGYRDQTLWGVTGSGKTFTMANIIANVGRPTLVISHNKTLAAQLYNEFKDFFPDAAVHYFVSYYDYYQPEAYIPQTDTYIEKETKINEEIDRLRHAATQSLINRRDVIIVASVSCIYGLGEKVDYVGQSVNLKVGQNIGRQALLLHLIKIQYQRNDSQLGRGQFRVAGSNIDLHLATGEAIIRLELVGNVIDKIKLYPINPHQEPEVWLVDLNAKREQSLQQISILPAKHYLAPEKKTEQALVSIEKELAGRVQELLAGGKIAEADRLQRRTEYDLEMMRAVGYANGIENYSRHLSGRPAGSPPQTLIDFFPADYLMIVDESHVSLPQIRGMFAGDRSRKQNLIDFGFRLPSALDNRPLNYKEFRAKVNQVIYASATPNEYEIKKSQQIVEQIIRPTGLLDPEVEVRPVDSQIKDLLKEIKIRANKNERVLAITLTKRMAEELSAYLEEEKIKVTFIHSEVKALERVDILNDLKLGKYDALVGVNLLREGLDLPEVSLVAILNADMAGFLRNETSLVQTMGRAARHINGRVIMYANRITPAMQYAIDLTKKRRLAQEKYNTKHHIKPQGIASNVHKSMVEE